MVMESCCTGAALPFHDAASASIVGAFVTHTVKASSGPFPPVEALKVTRAPFVNDGVGVPGVPPPPTSMTEGTLFDPPLTGQFGFVLLPPPPPHATSERDARSASKAAGQDRLGLAGLDR